MPAYNVRLMRYAKWELKDKASSSGLNTTSTMEGSQSFVVGSIRVATLASSNPSGGRDKGLNVDDLGIHGSFQILTEVPEPIQKRRPA
ncbi:UNVERIFIED_CONTAM: hypothetical protein Sradi_3568300 [Sesamum radiatum]|uniref:Uncharacterized protein n=1 Tax=Sesamum radiatum TaxID=300843 RepID=A0AAW2QH11_SESRA